MENNKVGRFFGVHSVDEIDDLKSKLVKQTELD